MLLVYYDILVKSRALFWAYFSQIILSFLVGENPPKYAISRELQPVIHVHSPLVCFFRFVIAQDAQITSACSLDVRMFNKDLIAPHALFFSLLE